ncbi:MAG: NADH dehydrogenase [Blautia sp.]|nr:NADH dehydrogenase [Blautia sp.]
MLIFLIVFGPFLCGILSWLLGRKNEEQRDWFVIAVTGAELILTLLLLRGGAAARIPGILAGGLTFTTDGFRMTYAVITAVMWAGTTLFAKEYFREEREHLNRYWLFIIVTLGATEGVMLSGDMMTTFVFFEILSFTSFTWVIQEETPGAVRAGYTYLFIAVIGGLVLFMGLALLSFAAGTLSYAELSEAVAATERPELVMAAGVCILIGFGAKAGMFPVHIWLPKAHPVAPSPASALLSGILTKVGIYGILMVSMNALFSYESFGFLVLILGVITMALGAVLALFSINLKRTLACSSMSQIGFILTGVGMMILLRAVGSSEGAGTAMSGLMLHMVNHSLIKLTLFMAAGVVVMKIHVLTLNEIRGFGRSKLLFKIAFALGALGISGVPLFNGYLSKTLLHEGIVEGIHECARYSTALSVIEWIFLFSGGLTFAYMLKLFICIFVQKNRDPKRQQFYDSDRRGMDMLSTIAVVGSSLLMVVLGQPYVATHLAAFMNGYEEILHFHAFSWENLKGGLISLSIGAVVYLLFVRKVLVREDSYVELWPAGLDVILKPLCRAGMFLWTCAVRVFDLSTDGLIRLLRKTVVREKKVKGRKSVHPGLLRTMSAEISGGAEPVTSNFTFALMMTCIGIIVILLAILLSWRGWRV